MKYFVIAGEASGDLHAAGLIEALRREEHSAEIRFLGGDLMAAAAGRAPEIHYKAMAYMGFSEVIRHLPDVKRNLDKARAIIDTWRPDAVVLVDYPGFNLKIASHAHKRGIKVYYYISPKVWAWKEYRVKQIRRDVDYVYSILPFEEEFYHRHGMRVDYVGNPSVIEVDRRLKRDTMSDGDFFASQGLSPAPVLALVPGSRLSEIRNNLPVMAAVAARHPEYQAVIAGAPAIAPEVYAAITDLPVITGATFEIMHHARAALVTSGTATLECALAGTPQVACYRGNGSRLTYAIMSRWLKIPYVTLPNLIASAEVIPEKLMHHCNVGEVDAALAPLLGDTPARSEQLRGYALIRERLGSHDPAVTTARAITHHA